MVILIIYRRVTKGKLCFCVRRRIERKDESLCWSHWRQYLVRWRHDIWGQNDRIFKVLSRNKVGPNIWLIFPFEDWSKMIHLDVPIKKFECTVTTLIGFTKNDWLISTPKVSLSCGHPHTWNGLLCNCYSEVDI